MASPGGVARHRRSGLHGGSNVEVIIDAELQRLARAYGDRARRTRTVSRKVDLRLAASRSRDGDCANGAANVINDLVRRSGGERDAAIGEIERHADLVPRARGSRVERRHRDRTRSREGVGRIRGVEVERRHRTVAGYVDRGERRRVAVGVVHERDVVVAVAVVPFWVMVPRRLGPFAGLRVPVDVLGILLLDDGEPAHAGNRPFVLGILLLDDGEPAHAGNRPFDGYRWERELLGHRRGEGRVGENLHGRFARGEVDFRKVNRDRAGSRQRERGGDGERIAAKRLDRGTRRNIQTRHLGSGEQRALLHQERRRALDLVNRVREPHRARTRLRDVPHERRAPHDRRAFRDHHRHRRLALDCVQYSLRRLERTGAVDVELATVGEEVDAVFVVGALLTLEAERGVLHVDILELDVFVS